MNTSLDGRPPTGPGNAPGPHVVILGCGFAGLDAAKVLKHAPVRVTVLDRSNHYLFQPLLYQVATAALNASDIASPIRRVLRYSRNTEVELADVVAIDPASRRITLADGVVPYDYLIVATGATHSYFGHDDWAKYAPGLKSLEDALEIRRRMLLAFEAAEREDDPERRREWMTFVFVGGGPTGVELAGTFRDVAAYTLGKDFRRIDATRARVVLIEGSPRVLNAYPPDLSQKAKEQLEAKGVEVRTGGQVTAIDADGVNIGDERIAAKTVFWAAGVAGSPLAKSLGVPLDRAGRVLVEPDLSVPGHPEIFVVGDLMHLEQDGHLVPGVAPAAMQSGHHAARNVLDAIRGQPTRPFRYNDKGSMATIGRYAAVAQVGRWKFSGILAWLSWLLIHIFFLVGFRNRLLVLLQWGYIYLTYDRGARLITTRAAGPLRAMVESRPSLANVEDMPAATVAEGIAHQAPG